MEKKKIMLIAISLMLIPSLAQALPFKNINFEKNITSPFIAGSTQQIIVTFDNDANTNQTLAIELNATSSSADYPVWKGDFSIAPILNSGGTLYSLDCEERSNGTFYCYNKLEYIVQPNSFNNLTIYVTPKINLYPTVYNFGLLLSAEAGAPVEKSQREINFTANETTSIDARNETDVILDVMTNQNMTGSINITTYDSVIVEGAFGVTALNKYIGIEVSQNVKDVLGWTIIKIYYTDAEVSGIEESSLRIYYYNGTDWQPYDSPNGGVDTTANYVWANTTHFSLWGVYGNLILSAPSPAAPTGGAGFPTKFMSISSEDSITIAQGESQVLRISVTNNAIALYDVAITLSGVDSKWFNPMDLGNLARDKTKIADMIITIPDTADIEDYAAKIVAKDGAGYVANRGLTIKVKSQSSEIQTPSPTPTNTTPSTSTTTAIPSQGLLTGFIAFVGSPFGLSLLLSLTVATVLIIVFYKRRYAKKKSEEKIIPTTF